MHLHRTDSQVSGLLSPMRKSMDEGPQRTKPVLCYIAPAGSEQIRDGKTFDFSTVCDAVSCCKSLHLASAFPPWRTTCNQAACS